MSSTTPTRKEIIDALHGADGAIDALCTQLEQLKRLASPDDTGPDEALADAESSSAVVQGLLNRLSRNPGGAIQ